MHKQRIFNIVAASIGVFSFLMPWFILSTGSLGNLFGDDFSSMHMISGFHGLGILVFLFYVGAFIIPFLGNKHLPYDKTIWMISLCLYCAAFLVTFIVFAQGGEGNFIISLIRGPGIYLSFVTCLVGIFGALKFKSPDMNLQSGFESIKSDFTSSVNKYSSNQNKSQQRSTASKIDELEKLIIMKRNGDISMEEFDRLKRDL